MTKRIAKKITAVTLSLVMMMSGMAVALPFIKLPQAKAASNAEGFEFDIAEGSITVGSGTDENTIKVTYAHFS